MDLKPRELIPTRVHRTRTHIWSAKTSQIASCEHPALRQTATALPIDVRHSYQTCIRSDIVLHCPHGLSMPIDALIADFIASGIIYVGSTSLSEIESPAGLAYSPVCSMPLREAGLIG